MRVPFLYGKVHRAVITEADLNYEGSLTLDQDLMDGAAMVPFQQIDVYNVTNGNRFTTYLIPGPRGKGDCCTNGAAAHLARPGDKVIIAAYCDLEPSEIPGHKPKIVLVKSADNRQFEVKDSEAARVKVPM